VFAICFTRPGTTLTMWLNKFHAGGFIWSLVRTPRDWQHPMAEHDGQYWNQPPLRFSTVAEAQEFIQVQLSGNPQARVERVAD
jgi:hypothetical protein